MQVTGVLFNQNFIEDYATPSGTERAQALLLSDFYGYLSIDGGSTF